MFYIYEWFNKKTNEIFYVGKGTNNRYKVKNRNSKFNKYISENECDVRIIAYYEDELLCFKKEEERIQELIKIGQCSCNNKYGGNGGVKSFWTCEMRKKMSEQNPMKDEQQRARMKEKNPMKNRDIALKVGEKQRKKFYIGDKFYNGLSEAATFYNVSNSAISFWIKNGETPYGEKIKIKTENIITVQTNKEKCFIIFRNNTYKTLTELCEKENLSARTVYNWLKRGFSSKGEYIRYSNDNKEYTYVKPNKIHNNIKIKVNGIIFNSKKDVCKFYKITPYVLDRLLNKKPTKKDKELFCEYVNQQPSHTNTDKSSVEGSTTNG